MFLSKNLLIRPNLWKRIFNNQRNVFRHHRDYNGLAVSLQNKYLLSYQRRTPCVTYQSLLHRNGIQKNYPMMMH